MPRTTFRDQDPSTPITAAWLNATDKAVVEDLPASVVAAQAAVTLLLNNFIAALNAPTGSTLVGFQRSGVGAVVRRLFDKLSDSVSVTDFGAKCDWNGTTGTDDSAAVQAAVNFCILHNIDLEVPAICRLDTPVNIDRAVDGAAFDKYFTIRGAGGFASPNPLAMFTSSYPFSSAPVSQFIRFQDISFDGVDSAHATYVLNGARFLRMSFDGCSFRRIKLAASNTVEFQTYRFTNCNTRRWEGTWFDSNGAGTFDVKFTGLIAEAGQSCLNLSSPLGTVVSGGLIEGCAGTAIKYKAAQSLEVSGVYFEANRDADIDGSAGVGAMGSDSVVLSANWHDCDPIYRTTAAILWGDCSTGVSVGNFSKRGILHNLLPTSYVEINDRAQGVTVNAQPRRYFRDYTTLGITYGGYLQGYGVVGQGGYLGIGTMQNNVFAEALTITPGSNVVSGFDNLKSLGDATHRWSQLFAGSAVINTSDAREKQQIRELTAAERAVAVRCKGLLRAFKSNDAVELKADGARIHFGIVAQELKAAFEAEGLVAENYGVLCHDTWEARPAGPDANGVMLPAREAGDRYGVRYVELYAFILCAL